MNMRRAVRVLLQISCLALFVSILIPADAQESQSSSTSVAPLIRQMTGTWQVCSRMSPGPNAKAIDLPQSVARRELIRDAYLQEVIDPSDKSAEPPFTRIAYFIFNAVNQQYEYLSIDSRLSQMMSYIAPGANKMRDGKVELTGSSFVAPEWGAKKTAFACLDEERL